MTTHALSLTHLARRPTTGASAPPLLLLLHGYGSNEHDLFGLAPYLDQRFLIVSVRAPYMLMPGSYGWFELGFTQTSITIDPAQAEASRELLVRFIGESTAAYGADPERVFLLGFSQGAMMAASVTLTRPELVAATVLMSGSLPPEAQHRADAPERLKDKPILVVHGTLDPVLPIELGRASRAALARLPVDLSYHEYPMAHEVSAESLADVTDWLSGRLT